MRNKKGQALIEFVLILPILIMIIFCIIDFGRIIIARNQLENRLNDIVIFLDNEKSSDISKVEELVNKDSDNNVVVSLSYGTDSYLTIKVETEVDIITPGLNLILGTRYKASSERVIVYDRK